jgi:hypothetical protein
MPGMFSATTPSAFLSSSDLALIGLFSRGWGQATRADDSGFDIDQRDISLARDDQENGFAHLPEGGVTTRRIPERADRIPKGKHDNQVRSPASPAGFADVESDAVHDIVAPSPMVVTTLAHD